MPNTPPRVAVFGIGLAAYWPQFDGLRDRLDGYQHGIERRLEEMGAEVVSAGLVDTPQAARAAGTVLAAAQPELLLVYTATYATSSQVLPVVQAVAAPVVVLNLQPTRTVDYERMTTGEWLANCSACCVPEIAGALTRARIAYSTVTGTLADDDAAFNIRKAMEVARRQKARSLELRAAVTLTRLVWETKQRREAQAKLAEIVSQFSEGFDTIDLLVARGLLAEA